MLSKEMSSDIKGYNLRTYAVDGDVETANLYRGKTKIGTISVSKDEVVNLEIRTDKEEMKYQETISDLEYKNLINDILQFARQKKFEDGIKERLDKETIFMLKNEAEDVIALLRPFNEGGKEEMERLYGGQIELCYNRVL